MSGHRILFDASMIQGGGGFTFVAHVLPALAAGHPNDHFRVFVRNPQLADALPALPNLQIDRLPPPSLLDRLRFTYLDAPRIARAWGADLYFSAGDYAPLFTGCPVIASAQNANVSIPWRERRATWNTRQLLRLTALNLFARISAATCDAIHYVSADSARRMGDALQVPPWKRVFSHHGIDAARWRAGGARPHARPYVLSLSSIYRYKNFARLVEAWTQLARRRPATPDLLIVGDNQDADAWAAMEAARDAAGPLASRIRFVGEVAPADVPRWYAHADLFVFPSHLESFGLPLLESMAAGAPLVASNLPVFHEIAADAAFYFDPFDVPAIAKAMEEALFAPGAREMLVKRGRERARAFTWRRSAAELMQIFERVIQSRAEACAADRLPAPQRRPVAVFDEPAAIGSSARAAI